MIHAFKKNAWNFIKGFLVTLILLLVFQIIERNWVLNSALERHKGMTSGDVKSIYFKGGQRKFDFYLEDSRTIDKIIFSFISDVKYGYFKIRQPWFCYMAINLEEEVLEYRFVYSNDEERFYFLLHADSYIPSRDSPNYYFNIKSQVLEELLMKNGEESNILNDTTGCLDHFN